MAVIGKIREKSTLLLITIGGALVLFILGSLVESGGSVFKGSQTIVGEIDGQSVDIRDFEGKFQESLKNYEDNYNTQTVDQATTEAIRNQTWDQMVNEMIMVNEREELGITVTSDELFDMVQGPNPDPRVVQAFSDPNTQQFDPNRVLSFLKNMDADDTGDSKRRWKSFENDLKKQRLNDKYLNLIKKGLYVTSVEAENDYVASNKRVDIRYVAKSYISMPDSAVKISDSELKKYLNDNKEKYKQEETREIEFVSFDVKPSQEDIDAVTLWINEVTTKFATAEDDSAFINEKTDPGKEYYEIWKTKEDLEDGLDTALFDASVGKIYGPYKSGDTYKVAKLLGTKMAPDSVKARHILLAPTKQGDTEEKLKADADSLKNLVKSGKATFEELATRLSSDKGSAEKGGDLGWFREGMMVKPFNDAAFGSKKGELTVAVSQFGIHLIEVTDMGPNVKKANIGVIQRVVLPSSKTYQTYYTQAEQFSRENDTEEKFEAAVVDQGLNKRLSPPLKPNDGSIPGLESARPIVKWAYGAEEGAVSKVFDLDDKFIVAVVTKVREKGYASLEDVKPEIEAEVRKAKKAEKFVAEFNDALKSNKDIVALGTAVNAPVSEGQNITFFQGNIPGLGREPELAGTVITMKAGEMTKPIIGKNAVYVAVVDNVIEAPEAQNLNDNKQRLGSYLSNRAGEAYEALKENAGVVDNRAKFY